MAGIVSTDGLTTSVTIKGVTYEGTAYSDVWDALYYNGVVAVAGGTYTVKNQITFRNRYLYGTDGATIANNVNTSIKGVVINSQGDNSTISGMTFARNASSNGGAIVIDYGTLSISDSAFTGNTASTYGGAIMTTGDWSKRTNKLVLENVQFSGNSAQTGGALYLDSTDKIHVIASGGADPALRSEFSANSVRGEGGAIYVNAGGFNIDGAIFSGNYTTGNSGGGGAIFIGRAATLSKTITGATFNGNYAANNDGGALLAGAFVTVSDTLFTGNHANNGGAIFNVKFDESSATGTLLTIEGSTFCDNYAAASGGAVKISNGDGAVVSESTFCGNTANNDGALTNNSTTVITGGYFIGNEARNVTGGGYGGAIYNESGTLTLEKTILSENTATNGGAVNNKAELIIAGSTFARNIGSGYGGAVFLDASDRVNQIGNATDGVTRTVFDGNSNVGSGGAVYVNVGGADIDNAIFTGNHVQGNGSTGGALYFNVYATSQNTVDGATFSGNYSSDSTGGAVGVKSNATFRDTLFTGNTATNGGAVHNSGTTVIDGGIFSGNTARVVSGVGFGGAIYNDGGNLSVTAGAVFSGNAARNGAAIGVTGGTLAVSGSTFAGNEARDYGGAIFINTSGTSHSVGSEIDTVSGETIRTVFDGNVNLGSGGAIYVNTGGIHVSDAIFVGNRVTGNSAEGGAVYLNAAATAGSSISGSTFSGNSAVTNTGGALSVHSAATISDSVFATATDSIQNTGFVTFDGTNRINAALTGNGSYTLTSGAALIFGNTSSIGIAGLTFSGSNAVTFNGSAAVNFTADGGQDLSDVAITVDGSVYAGEAVTVATGVTGIGSYDVIGDADLFLKLDGTDLVMYERAADLKDGDAPVSNYKGTGD
ncbi:MAG: hypothetical protein MR051_00665 [Lentisphaeria bacterium]|nr:hypothetical protein [Lentisphaeria bacterium]